MTPTECTERALCLEERRKTRPEWAWIRGHPDGSRRGQRSALAPWPDLLARSDKLVACGTLEDGVVAITFLLHSICFGAFSFSFCSALYSSSLQEGFLTYRLRQEPLGILFVDQHTPYTRFLLLLLIFFLLFSSLFFFLSPFFDSFFFLS
jgi:hypothetical protein